MDLIELTKKELERGFTKSELERLWLLPKNSLSAVLNPDLPAKFSKKSEIRVREYFETPLESRPKPSLKISRGRPKNEKPETTVGVIREVARRMGREAVAVKSPKWDFSEVIFLNVEDFTEYPKSKCPAGGFERREYLAKKKEADGEIRAAFREYQKTNTK